jgi:hypothetical protein
MDVYVDYLSYTYTYGIAWNPLSASFSQNNSSPDYPALYAVVGQYTMSSGSSYNLRADGSGGVYDVVQV